MKREIIIHKLESILEQYGLGSTQINLGRSTALGVNNKVLFDVIDGGFIVSVRADRLVVLEGRPEASMVTDNFEPTSDKLFIGVKENDDDVLQFWANEGLKSLDSSS